MATKQTLNVAQGTVNIGLNAGLAATKGTVNIATGAVTAVGGTALDFATGTLDVVTGLVQNKHKRPGVRRQDSRLAWDSRVTAPYIKLDLFIECVRLPKKDSFSQADAFCGLWEAPPGFSTDKRVSKLPLKQEKEIGRTEVVRANKNPRFETAFRLEYKFQEEQTYVIRVYDEDLRYATDLKEHDFVGGCVFTLGELMGAGGCAIARPLHRGKAYVALIGQEIIETREVLEFRFSGQDLGLLERKHKAVLTKDVLESVQKLGKKVTKEMLENMQKVNIAKNVLDKFNPFFRLEKLNPEDQSWIVVWKSEVIRDNNHPTWNSARLPLQLLCDDDPTSPLKITLWVWNRFAPEELVGYVETTVCELVMKAKGGIPVFGVMKEKKKIFGGTKLKKAGSLKVLKSNVVQVPSMLQFFAGGCEMDLMVAVDCTSFVNGSDWRDDKNLHYRSNTWLNDYQAAIRKVGTIYQAYEGEREFTMFGYGAKIREIWQPSFVMGEKLDGADGLLRAYDETFATDNEDLEMSMAGQLSNIVQAAMFRAIHKNEERQCYSTLVILSTGVIDDVRGTMDAICAAAEDAPLSIVIIGIGTGDFSKVLTLTGAEVGKLRHSNGVPIARECVNFVRLSEFHGNASRCVSESLSSVPEQFVQYFLNSGVLPHPGKELPDFASQEFGKDFRKLRSKKQRLEAPLVEDDDRSTTSSVTR
ncbi:copine, variant 2 [Mayamaea pseudoterrestris]|nr:copine, variant 2 [Mayamaea pseudoterrestris]